MKKPQKKPGKVIKTYELALNAEELLHLRDLFGVHLPPDMSQTVSQFLANTEGRALHEAKLWDKLSKLCERANVPLDDEAPDYVIAPTGPTPMGVYRLQQTEEEANAAEGGASIFDLPETPPPAEKKKTARKKA